MYMYIIYTSSICCIRAVATLYFTFYHRHTVVGQQTGSIDRIDAVRSRSYQNNTKYWVAMTMC